MIKVSKTKSNTFQQKSYVNVAHSYSLNKKVRKSIKKKLSQIEEFLSLLKNCHKFLRCRYTHITFAVTRLKFGL